MNSQGLWGISPYSPRRNGNDTIPPVDPAPSIWWGARAIYTRGLHALSASIDIPFDRRQTTPRDPARAAAIDREAHRVMEDRGSLVVELDARALWFWLDEYGMPALRRMLAEAPPSSDDDREVSLTSHGFTLVANPRRSFGYLYIGAWPTDPVVAMPHPWVPPKLTDARENALRSCMPCHSFRYRGDKLVSEKAPHLPPGPLKRNLEWLREEGLVIRCSGSRHVSYEITARGERAIRAKRQGHASLGIGVD